MRTDDKRVIRKQHRASDFRNVELELELLSGICKNVRIMDVICGKFDTNYVTSEIVKWIIDRAFNLYVEQNELMDVRALEHTLNVEKKKRKRYTAMWKRSRKMRSGLTIASTLACAQRLEKLYRARCLQIGFKGMVGTLKQAHDGDYAAMDDVPSKLDEMSSQIATDQSHSTIAVIEAGAHYKEYKKQFRAEQKNPSMLSGVMTGISEIDRQMNGLRAGEFAVVGGETGSGKSVTLMNFATSAWHTAGDAIMVTIEMPASQYESRLLCQLSGINYDHFRKRTLNQSQWDILDRVAKRMRKNRNKFVIIDMPHGCTIPAIRSEVGKAIKKSKNVGVCGVDYMNIISGPSGEVDFSWQNQLEIAVGLKLSIARALHIPVWTVSQTDKDNDGLGFSSHIADQVDVAALLKKDEASEETGILFWDWIKTRDFKGRKIPLETKLANMCISSQLLSVTSSKRRKKLKRIAPKKRKIKI